jgi:hypothetical protein
MKLFSMTKALVAAGAVASAVAFTVPASAAAHAPAVAGPAAHQVTAARVAFPGDCSLKFGVRLVIGSKVHGIAVLRCGHTVTNIKVKVKLYRTGVLIARDTNRVASGTNVRAEATRTCVNPDQGIFQAKARATYDYRGHARDTGWFTSSPLGGPCGV